MVGWNDFVTAIGLALVIEGLLYGLVPLAARKMWLQMGSMPEQVIRISGLAAVAFGVLIVWLVRG